MIYAITRNPTAILFVALSPMMMIGGWFENRSAGKLGKKNYVADALTCVLEEREVEPAETKSYGCSVKDTSAGI